MEFSRQEYWNGQPFPSPGDLPDPGIEPKFLMSLHWQVGSLPLMPSGKPMGFEFSKFDFSLLSNSNPHHIWGHTWHLGFD